MSARGGVLAAGLLLVTAGPVAAQVRTTVRAQTVVESYSFEAGALPYSRVIETAVPVGIDLAFGRRVDVSISSGYVSLALYPDSAFRWVAGLIDTQARVGINVIPGRLIMVVNGTVPTGVRVFSQEATVLTPVASEVIGFAIPTLGAGGSLGGGFVGAIPAGKFAIGLGATYAYPLSYRPFRASTTELSPGSEFRTRMGIEGPLARRTYLRLAGVLALRGKDVLTDTAALVQPGIGQRYIGYAEVAQGLGRMQLTMYGFDVYRGSPAVEGTALGAAVLPKGNLIATGFRLAVPVTQSLSVAPRLEWRLSTAAAVDSTDANGTPITYGPLLKAGATARIGLDVRQAFSPGMSLALFGSGLFGNIRPQGGADVSVSGWRAGLVFSVTR